MECPSRQGIGCRSPRGHRSTDNCEQPYQGWKRLLPGRIASGSKQFSAFEYRGQLPHNTHSRPKLLVVANGLPKSFQTGFGRVASCGILVPTKVPNPNRRRTFRVSLRIVVLEARNLLVPSIPSTTCHNPCCSSSLSPRNCRYCISR